VTRRAAPEVRGEQSGHINRTLGVLTLAALVLCVAPATPVELVRIDVDKPSFTLQDLNGSSVSLHDFAGHPVFVHFFATWCEPCREELPALTRLRERAPAVAVLAISVAENGRRVSRFFAQAPTNFPVLLDADRAVAKAWDITTLPTTYVLDAGLRPQRVVERDYPWDTVSVAPDGQFTMDTSSKTQPTSE
jgi:peroxiredoxin